VPNSSSGDAAGPRLGEGASAGVALYVVAILSSAFLLFLVQPMVGKRILPWFGGVPAVWTLCLAFFQSALFLGYAYAHLLTRFAPPKAQLAVHALAIGAALAALPVLPGQAPAASAGADPTAAILLMLMASVALPFLVLASTGPLVQVWFARAHPDRSPYPLYAVSNLGSLLALFAYPFLIEPRLPLSETGTAWTVGFSFASLAVLGCAAAGARAPAQRRAEPVGAESGVGDAISAGRVAFWLLLPGCAVVLLMSITNTICLDVASVPFLWILPLAVYLATFILCFSTKQPHRRSLNLAITFVALFLLNLDSLLPGSVTGWVGRQLNFIPAQIGIYSALLYGLCMLLHGELYRLRPAPDSLTVFYLCLSGGGALGGMFVGIGAPMLFDTYRELAVGLGLAGVLVLAACATDPSSALRMGGPRWRWGLVATLGLGVLVAAGWRAAHAPPGIVHRERTFFGVLEVVERGEGVHRQRRLMNGTTLHGVQFLAPNWQDMPSSYYGRATGLGLVLGRRSEETAARIGVVGLGVGTLAAYGGEGDVVRFYEIDPAVVRIAGDDGYFSYLDGSAARVEIVVGDARLSLAEEQARGALQAFDFLIVDAFSSDAIPVHLLTREAFTHYRAALADHGLLAFHVSNRHFNLQGLVGRMGTEVGLHSLVVNTRAAPRLQSATARWVLLAREPEQIEEVVRRILKRRRELGLPPGSIQMIRFDEDLLSRIPAWTDDYSDLFRVLK
jgi:hypothetical protein